MSRPGLDTIRQVLKQTGTAHPAVMPQIPPSRIPGTEAAEVELFIQELTKISGNAMSLPTDGVRAAIHDLVMQGNIRRAALWNTPNLKRLGLESILEEEGIALAPPAADKHSLAGCDLGITEADFLLPETGTIGLLSSAEKPRTVSLLPRVHLAIASRKALRADLGQVFSEAKNQSYLVLITGPSRTSDIELTLTLGVHGPHQLHVWIVD